MDQKEFRDSVLDILENNILSYWLTLRDPRGGFYGEVDGLGRIDPDEVYEYYAIGDIFLSASTFEVHSMSYLEALSCGLPLVCREDKSIEGVIFHGENGFIYRTEREFIKYVSKLLDDPELRKKMSENAVRTAAEFTDEICVERTFALYEEVVGKCSR